MKRLLCRAARVQADYAAVGMHRVRLGKRHLFSWMCNDAEFNTTIARQYREDPEDHQQRRWQCRETEQSESRRVDG